jgi:hypothetical protein
MRPRRFLWVPWLALLAAGCVDEPATQTTAQPKIKARETIGKTTQDIRAVAPEVQHGGAQVVDPRARGPIMLPNNAYFSIVGQATILNIQHALDLYQAEHGEYPKNLDEFMNEIIKPNGIVLPTLPYYQEWGYDAPTHQLVILEYPERKAQFQEQQNQQLGRKSGA